MAKLDWLGAYLFKDYAPEMQFSDAAGEVRTRCEGLEYDYVTHLGKRAVSEPYERKEDAMQDCEAEVRRILAEHRVSVEPMQ